MVAAACATGLYLRFASLRALTQGTRQHLPLLIISVNGKLYGKKVRVKNLCEKHAEVDECSMLHVNGGATYVHPMCNICPI